MESEQIKDMRLHWLGTGAPALTPAQGEVLAHSAAISLESCTHHSGVSITVDGDFSAQYRLRWRPTTDQMRRCYNDEEVATEHGAYGIAILLLRDLAGYTVVERSRKGTGFDYWLGDDDDLLFQKKARLEVSGSRSQNATTLTSRVKQKVKQTAPSDNTGLPAYIAVVGFADPCAEVVKK
ncbi:MAG: hypothetical protein ACYDBB_10770 [Armatimonadota bacterium]